MKCMVVCSHALVREGLSRLFAQLDDHMEVLEAADVPQATALLAAQDDIELIFHYLSRDEAGWQALAELLEAVDGAVPVVVTADFESDKEIRRAIALGAQGCVSTGYTWVTVVTVIKRVLAGEIVSPSLDFRVQREEVEVQAPAAERAQPPAAEQAQPSARNGTGALHLNLTPRQVEVLELIRRGQSNKEIARTLNMAEGTVKIHCVAIFRELGVKNRTQAAIIAEQVLGE